MESSSSIGQWAYIAACVIVPAAWGAITAWIFSRRDRKGAGSGKQEGPARPPMDYVI